MIHEQLPITEKKKLLSTYYVIFESLLPERLSIPMVKRENKRKRGQSVPSSWS